jgi:hypothetical protein
MDHDEWNDIFALGDDAPPEKKKEADLHLAGCEECKKVAAGFALFKEALLDDADEVDDPKVREQVLAAAQAQLEDGSRPRRTKRLAFLIALALLVVGLVVWRWSSQDPIETKLHGVEDDVQTGNFQRAREGADQVLGLPDATEAQKERARRLKERAH